MSRVRSFFLAEADRWLAELRKHVDRSPLDVDAIYRAVRRFRGNAQMARFSGLATTARRLETRVRPLMGRGAAADGALLRPEIRAVLESLERGVDAVRDGRLTEDSNVEAGMDEQGMSEQGVRGKNGSAEGDAVAVETLEFRGDEALDRALSLREPLEDAIVEDRQAGPILDELFDLIRLGAK